jgi:hypothetical protein
MSDGLTSLTLSKRKLMTCLSSAATVVVGAFSLPRTALAKDMNSEVDSKGIDQSEAGGLVEHSADLLGVMILVPFEGPIKAYPVTGPGKTIQINAAGYEPPAGRTTLARTNLYIEVFDANSTHVHMTNEAGDNICVLRQP